MTSHVGRLYALALALVVFFLGWAVVAAQPWATPAADPRLQALAAREAQLRHEATAREPRSSRAAGPCTACAAARGARQRSPPAPRAGRAACASSRCRR